MISLSTAKLLLFIALCLGPKYGDTNHTIQITSKTSYSVWTENSGGWSLIQKPLASDSWPSNGDDLSTQELNQFGKVNAKIVRAISKHDWTHDSILYFENGDIVQKHGNTLFYTINAGGYNQQVFIIQTIENGKPL